MITAVVTTFAQWRVKARYLLTQQTEPDAIFWESTASVQPTLFAEPIAQTTQNTTNTQTQFLIPKRFLSIAKIIACHRDPLKWDKLYRALWRLTHGEPHLLAVSSDKLIHNLQTMHKAITRDAHKMKAFVRFCKFTEEDGSEYFLAWYKPDHLIVHLVAPFFQTRFAVMNWTIITPDETVHWNGEQLSYSAGKVMVTNPVDELEDLWKTYYKAIFNPARIKIKAMKKEMPIRHWHNLPETQTIASLLQEAPERVAEMMRHQEGLKSSAKEYIPEALDNTSVSTLKQKAKHCQACPLYEHATQTVFGVGSKQARLVLVGEQPGNQEDLQGEPFVGPAGQLLKKAIKELDIDIEEIYLTNAVKHFKFNLKNGRRIHASPGIREINACKPWVLAELAVIQPRVVLCLGLTAAKALISPAFRIKQERGNFKTQEKYIIGATFHPSAILRAITPELGESMYNDLINDIKKAYQLSS